MARQFSAVCWLGLLLGVLIIGCSEPAMVDPQEQPKQKQPAQELTDSSASPTSFVTHKPLVPGQLSELAKTQQLETLEIHRGSCDKAELLLGLTQWKNLKRLRLEECSADDELLSAIGSLHQLEVLNLPNGDFTDKGLAAIARMPKLFLLRVGSPNVSNAGVAKLATAPSLRFLHLVNVPVTDEGLTALHPMRQLESFYIDGGKETDDGIRDLLKANPTLHFHRNQVHIEDDPNSDGH